MDDESRDISERMRVHSYFAVWECGNLFILQFLVLQSKCDGACEGREWSSDDCIGRVGAGHSTS